MGKRPERQEPTLADLIEQIENPEHPMRAFAFSKLESFGEQARAAVPALLAVVENPDDQRRGQALKALENLQHRALVESPRRGSPQRVHPLYLSPDTI